ncbi:MAG: tRNA 2-thiouridine(34) synthase MnmA [Phycisphaerae bacterium]|nr:tRNA 2-thiouridine(34) synthase MnmA [Phycisphaerae bacterium]
MSGGVDSSVAAALLVRQGFDVVGCFMRLGSPGESLDQLVPGEACDLPGARAGVGPGEPGGAKVQPGVKIGHQGCCSVRDAADARLVAAQLGIPFYVCNFKKDFNRIIDYFAGEYAAGRTPNPCVRCNDWLKFGKLREYAAQIGAGFVASGHYARVGRDESGEQRLFRGYDSDKDQSYVLFGVPREHLAHVMLPIGGFEKPMVREMAKRFGLPVFDKPDSQEICFVPDNDYAGLLERRDPALSRPGRVVDAEGREVGAHEGQHRYTIGQRRGLSVSLGYPVYVVRKDAASNTVVVGPREELASTRCEAGEANWLVDEWDGPRRVFAKYRYNSDPVGARATLERGVVSPGPSGRAGAFSVVFDEPQIAVAPGQAIVLYDHEHPDVVLGGGWITRAERAGGPV